MSTDFDVVVCGGGLAGLTFARQIRRDHPAFSVAVVEKTARPLPEAGHKVGESTVELGSQYLGRLGLRDYLHERHLIKFGLRFFPGGGHLPIEERIEIGPINQPVVSSYQIDRGRFESDLRDMVVDEDGVRLFEGATVRDYAIGPGDTPHHVEVETQEGRVELSARWLVDATGRAGLLRGRMKLKRGGKHEANAGWFRIKGRFDINTLASDGSQRFMQVPEGQDRWLSTNHLMGEGYWVWLIPLASGYTSVGVVAHEHVHPFETVKDLEAVQAFLRTHEPQLAEALADAEVLDFRCLRRYCHTVSRCWHPDRWALIGEAGAFTDPLYSPGTDYIALANSFTAEMIQTDVENGDLLARSQELNAQYRALVSGSIGVYRESAAVYGHPGAMSTKVFWDNHVYWSFPCQFFQQNIYRLSGEALMPFTLVGARFVELSGRMQDVLKYWAEHVEPSFGGGDMVVVPAFPSMLVDSHCALTRKLSHAETLSYMQAQLAAGEELFAEIVLRVTLELGPIAARHMWDELGIREWGLSLPEGRVAAEELDGRARRRALPSVSRDIERALGMPRQSTFSVAEVGRWMTDRPAEPRARAEA
ncbi:MAG: NAD(P)/FAD-dependent oxidoreductase [Myxococcota bacterium]